MNQPNSIAIDVAKNAQFCELDARRNVTRDESVRRAHLLENLARLAWIMLQRGEHCRASRA